MINIDNAGVSGDAAMNPDFVSMSGISHRRAAIAAQLMPRNPYSATNPDSKHTLNIADEQ